MSAGRLLVAALALLAALALPVALPVAPASPAGAQEGPLTARPRVLLAGQSPEVASDAVFRLAVRTEGVDDPASVEVAVTVHSAVTSRSLFALTLEGRLLGEVLDFLAPLPLADLPEAGDARQLELPLSELRLPRRPAGVYPVRVQLRDADSREVVDAFTTHLVVTPAPDSGLHPLKVAWAQPVHAEPALQPDGTRRLAPTDLQHLADLTASLAATDVPLTVAPVPETVEALARTAGEDPRAAAALDGLVDAQEGRQVVGGGYVEVDPAQLGAAGLGGALEDEIVVGNATLEELLGAQPDTATWLAGPTLDEETVDRLRALGVTRLVVPEEALEPVDRRLTPARPFLVEGGGSPPMRAAVADAGLAAHFGADRPGDDVLRAHNLLADLAVLFYDSPGLERGVVVRPPEGWVTEPRLLATVLPALGQSAVLDAVTVTELLREVPPDTDGGERLVRSLTPESSPSLGLTTADVAATRTRLNGYRAMVLGPAPPVPDLERRVLVALAKDLTPARRQAYLRGAEEAVAAEIGKILAPDGQRITLTAREGTIPLTLRNETGYPVQVRVRVGSDKLEFPEGDTRLVRLEGENTKLEVPVRARTSGAFRLQVSVASPDGRIDVRDARLTVRSTAASWVGVLLTGGAGAFLVVWWVRNRRSTRRDPRLVRA